MKYCISKMFYIAISAIAIFSPNVFAECDDELKKRYGFYNESDVINYAWRDASWYQAPREYLTTTQWYKIFCGEDKFQISRKSILVIDKDFKFDNVYEKPIGGYNDNFSIIDYDEEFNHGLSVSSVIAGGKVGNGPNNSHYSVAFNPFAKWGWYEVESTSMAASANNGISYARMNGYDVVNISLSVAQNINTTDIKTIIRNFVFNNNNKIPVVIAAGNDGNNIRGFFNTLCSEGALICVGGYTGNRISNESNYGRIVDIYAPYNHEKILEGKGSSGTSYSAPMVSSTISMMLGVNSHLGVSEITNILIQSSDIKYSKDLDEVDGEDDFGYFRSLNAYEAVKLAKEYNAATITSKECAVISDGESVDEAIINHKVIKWNDPENWTDTNNKDLKRIPDKNDIVQLNCTATLDGNYSVKELRIGKTGEIYPGIINSKLTVSEAMLNNGKISNCDGSPARVGLLTDIKDFCGENTKLTMQVHGNVINNGNLLSDLVLSESKEDTMMVSSKYILGSIYIQKNGKSKVHFKDRLLISSIYSDQSFISTNEDSYITVHKIGNQIYLNGDGKLEIIQPNKVPIDFKMGNVTFFEGNDTSSRIVAKTIEFKFNPSKRKKLINDVFYRVRGNLTGDVKFSDNSEINDQGKTESIRVWPCLESIFIDGNMYVDKNATIIKCNKVANQKFEVTGNIDNNGIIDTINNPLAPDQKKDYHKLIVNGTISGNGLINVENLLLKNPKNKPSVNVIYGTISFDEGDTIAPGKWGVLQMPPKSSLIIDGDTEFEGIYATSELTISGNGNFKINSGMTTKLNYEGGNVILRALAGGIISAKEVIMAGGVVSGYQPHHEYLQGTVNGNLTIGNIEDDNDQPVYAKIWGNLTVNGDFTIEKNASFRQECRTSTATEWKTIVSGTTSLFGSIGGRLTPDSQCLTHELMLDSGSHLVIGENATGTIHNLIVKSSVLGNNDNLEIKNLKINSLNPESTHLKYEYVTFLDNVTVPPTSWGVLAMPDNSKLSLAGDTLFKGIKKSDNLSFNGTGSLTIGSTVIGVVKYEEGVVLAKGMNNGKITAKEVYVFDYAADNIKSENMPLGGEVNGNLTIGSPSIEDENTISRMVFSNSLKVNGNLTVKENASIKFHCVKASYYASRRLIVSELTSIFGELEVLESNSPCQYSTASISSSDGFVIGNNAKGGIPEAFTNSNITGTNQNFIIYNLFIDSEIPVQPDHKNIRKITFTSKNVSFGDGDWNLVASFPNSSKEFPVEINGKVNFKGMEKGYYFEGNGEIGVDTVNYGINFEGGTVNAKSIGATVTAKTINLIPSNDPNRSQSLRYKVNGDLTIKSGVKSSIYYDQFQVNGELTLEDGASISIDDNLLTVNGKSKIDGSIIGINYGTLEINGDTEIGSSSKITMGWIRINNNALVNSQSENIVAHQEISMNNGVAYPIHGAKGKYVISGTNPTIQPGYYGRISFSGVANLNGDIELSAASGGKFNGANVKVNSPAIGVKVTNGYLIVKGGIENCSADRIYSTGEIEGVNSGNIYAAGTGTTKSTIIKGTINGSLHMENGRFDIKYLSNKSTLPMSWDNATVIGLQ